MLRKLSRERGNLMTDLKTYSTADIASLYGLRESYLRKLRQLRRGPKYSKLGRMVRYRREDVDRWLESALVDVNPEGLV